MLRVLLAFFALASPAHAATQFTIDYAARDLVYSPELSAPYYPGARPPVFTEIRYQLYLEVPYQTLTLPDGTFTFPSEGEGGIYTSISDTSFSDIDIFDVTLSILGGDIVQWSVYFGSTSGDGFQSGQNGDQIFRNPGFDFTSEPGSFSVTMEHTGPAPVPLPASALLLLGGLALTALRRISG